MEAPEGEGWKQDEKIIRHTWLLKCIGHLQHLVARKTEELERYYPNNVLLRIDIIPFWVNRMTFQGEELLGKSLIIVWINKECKVKFSKV